MRAKKGTNSPLAPFGWCCQYIEAGMYICRSILFFPLSLPFIRTVKTWYSETVQVYTYLTRLLWPVCRDVEQVKSVWCMWCFCFHLFHHEYLSIQHPLLYNHRYRLYTYIDYILYTSTLYCILEFNQGTRDVSPRESHIFSKPAVVL